MTVSQFTIYRTHAPTLPDLLPRAGDVVAAVPRANLEHPLEVEPGPLRQVAPAEHVHAGRVDRELGAHAVPQLSVRQFAPRART